jgi:hypothetical protein
MQRPIWWRVATRLSLLALLAACADVVTSPGVDSLAVFGQGASYYEDGPQYPPGPVPYQFKAATKIEVRAQVQWVPNQGKVIGQSTVIYSGTNAIARVDLTTELGSSSSPDIEREHEVPVADQVFWANAEYPMTSCSGTISARAFGKVWNRLVFMPWTWGTKSAADYQHKTCSPSSSGGGGEDSDCVTYYWEFYGYDDGIWTRIDSAYVTTCAGFAS